MSSATSNMANNLSTAILNQNDPETVKEGAPAYLLLIDSLIEANPDDIAKLETGSKLYSAYASIFVKDQARARRLAAKSLDYAKHALCMRNQPLCSAYERPFDEFKPVVEKTTNRDIEAMYVFGSAWATWVQASQGDWTSIANLPKITLMMQRIVVLQDDYDMGSPHLYLGILATQLPPSLGGKPEQARKHFERAIELSHGRNLMMKVLFAQHYARLLYDRELHDRLLNEVLQADPVVPKLTLMNTLAQQEAKALLDSANDYF